MKRLAVLFVFFVLTIPHANAQFFKKLKKKAENAVERTITRKTEREVEKTTDRALDSVMNAPRFLLAFCQNWIKEPVRML